MGGEETACLQLQLIKRIRSGVSLRLDLEVVCCNGMGSVFHPAKGLELSISLEKNC